MKITKRAALGLDAAEFLRITQVILAQKGKGKSYAAAVQAEELLEERYQVVALDPTGAWWGLRSSADGSKPGYPIVVLGGEHGDVPLEPTAGEVIAEAIATEHFSAIVDISLMRKNEALRFCAAFLETLYHKNREALHLFIDEADVVAPQKTFSPEQARALGAAEDIVRRGRIKGIGCTMITQRPQVLNKDVLSQADMLLALGMNHPKDLRAIDDWVSVHADAAQAVEMIESLPSMPVGNGWIWAPSVNLFQRVAIRPRRTFDSGRTPRAGERSIAPKTLASVDLAKLGAAIAGTVERAKSNDPRELKKRIADLEREFASKPKGGKTVRVEVPIIKDAQVKRMEAAIAKVEKLGVRFDSAIQQARVAADDLGRRLREHQQLPARPSAPPQQMKQLVRTDNRDGTQTWSPAADAEKFRRKNQISGNVAVARQDATKMLGSGERLPPGEAKILTAIIQHPGARREQLTVLTTYTRSSRNTYLQRLASRGLIETDGEGFIPTAQGYAELPNVQPLPTGRALQEMWLGDLPPGEAAILRLVIERRTGIDRDEISLVTGYTRSSRNTYLQKLAAKELVRTERSGLVFPSDNLFDE